MKPRPSKEQRESWFKIMRKSARHRSAKDYDRKKLKRQDQTNIGYV